MYVQKSKDLDINRYSNELSANVDLTGEFFDELINRGYILSKAGAKDIDDLFEKYGMIGCKATYDEAKDKVTLSFGLYKDLNNGLEIRFSTQPTTEEYMLYDDEAKEIKDDLIKREKMMYRAETYERS